MPDKNRATHKMPDAGTRATRGDAEHAQCQQQGPLDDPGPGGPKNPKKLILNSKT